MLDYYMISEKGDREINEDSITCAVLNDDYAAFILADGLGGHGRGDEASSLAVKTAETVYKAHYKEENVMEQMFEAAQQEVLRVQKEKGARRSMKTTLNILLLTPADIRIGHIGDSRTYYINKGKIICRTHDHSVPQALVDLGDIPEKKIRNHPDRNRLLRVVGEEWTGLSYEIMDPVERKADLSFLLCTDGFWELVDEKVMRKTLKHSHSAEEWARAMQDVVVNCKSEKNKDNYSVIAVRI